MTQPSPADQLRAAAEGLRLIEDDLPGWLRPLGEPLADWLDATARVYDSRDEGARLTWGSLTHPDAARFIQDGPGGGAEALAVARAITGDTT
ncbi:hypothetical protein [Streptomyces sp. CC208A]|uniref:hypothetical protein n=1 Tax=Streptomyces sp. CC208A TaxID=3044573 RepID=UPI0024A87324|nr:hypothetical protein [Streptomyces sp. CC208A]